MKLQSRIARLGRGSITIIETVLIMSLVGIIYLSWYHYFKDQSVTTVAKEKCIVDAGAALNDDDSIVDPDFDLADPCATPVAAEPTATPVPPPPPSAS